MTEIEEIRSDDGRVMAIIIKSEFNRDGVHFISQKDYPLQLGISGYKRGDLVKAHFHKARKIMINKIQEVVHIESGRCMVNLYDLDGKKIKSIELSENDTIMFIDGGHGFEMLEDTKIMEVKQGPYSGKNMDKGMIE